MPLEISRIRAICFDVDGTLWDSDDEVVIWLARLLGPFSPFLLQRNPLSAARRLVLFLETPGRYINNLRYQSQSFSRLVEIGSRLTGFHRSGASSSHLLVEGVPEMLAVLAPRFSLAIVSARPAQSTIEFLTRNNLLRYFQTVVTGQTCKRTKPHPDPILYAAQKMGMAPQNCLMVGDTTVDVIAGRRAGAQTVAVLCGFGEESELQEAGADLILGSTADLLRSMEIC
jgi:N-acetyl-D-muramate 6-phosphate phosphatase